jgi:hypothetical protein
MPPRPPIPAPSVGGCGGRLTRDPACPPAADRSLASAALPHIGPTAAHKALPALLWPITGTRRACTAAVEPLPGAPSVGHPQKPADNPPVALGDRLPSTITEALSKQQGKRPDTASAAAAAGWGADATGGLQPARTSWLGCSWWHVSSLAQLCGYQGLWRHAAAMLAS